VDQCHPIREHVAGFAWFRSALGADLRHWIDRKVVPVFCHAAGILTRGKAAPNGPFGGRPTDENPPRWSERRVPSVYSPQDSFELALLALLKSRGPLLFVIHLYNLPREFHNFVRVFLFAG